MNSPKNDVPAVIEPDPEIVRIERAQLESRVRELLNDGEMNQVAIQAALGLTEEEATEVLSGMRGLDQRLGNWWLTERKR